MKSRVLRLSALVGGYLTAIVGTLAFLLVLTWHVSVIANLLLQTVMFIGRVREEGEDASA